jgi:lipopolysaccharide export system permease protein
MPKVTILDRYILRETLGPMLFGLALLTFAMVAGRMLKLIELVMNHGVGVSDILKLIGFIMPGFLELTFPMAALLGVLLGFGRLSSDQEITAARACGISLYRMACPVLAMALIAYALSSWLAFSVRPWANARIRDSLYELTRTKAGAGLKENVFNKNFPGLVIYVNKIEPSDGTLRGVLISDARSLMQQNTIIARRGVLVPDESQQLLILRLSDGSIYGGDEDDDSTHVTSFRNYDLIIPPAGGLASNEHAPQEMRYPELRKVIALGQSSGKPNYEAETELARKFAVPLATVLFAVLGVALGLKPARGGQSERFGVALALFFGYYVLMRAVQTLAERGEVPALLAMSTPDVVFLALAIVIFYRAGFRPPSTVSSPCRFSSHSVRVWPLSPAGT